MNPTHSRETICTHWALEWQGWFLMFVATGIGGDKRNLEESGEGARAGASQYQLRSHSAKVEQVEWLRALKTALRIHGKRKSWAQSHPAQSFVTLTGQQTMVFSVSEPMGSTGIWDVLEFFLPHISVVSWLDCYFFYWLEKSVFVSLMGGML